MSDSAARTKGSEALRARTESALRHEDEGGLPSDMLTEAMLRHVAKRGLSPGLLAMAKRHGKTASALEEL